MRSLRRRWKHWNSLKTQRFSSRRPHITHCTPFICLSCAFTQMKKKQKVVWMSRLATVGLYTTLKLEVTARDNAMKLGHQTGHKWNKLTSFLTWQKCSIKVTGSVIFKMSKVTNQRWRSPGLTKLSHEMRRKWWINGRTPLKLGVTIAHETATCWDRTKFRWAQGQRITAYVRYYVPFKNEKSQKLQTWCTLACCNILSSGVQEVEDHELHIAS